MIQKIKSTDFYNTSLNIITKKEDLKQNTKKNKYSTKYYPSELIDNYWFNNINYLA